MEQTTKPNGSEKTGDFLNNAKGGIKKAAAVLLQIERPSFLMFSLPDDYGKYAKEELTVLAKKLYESIVSELLINGNTISGYQELKRNEIEILIFYYVYFICRADMNVSDLELAFLNYIEPKYSEVLEEFNYSQLKETHALFSAIKKTPELQPVMRDFMRLLAIAGSIDTGRLNLAETKVMNFFLRYAKYMDKEQWEDA